MAIARVGSTLPVVDSSVGRVFLTYLPRSITQPVVRTQQRYGESSTPTGDELRVITADIRQRGISTTVGGVLLGLIVVAAPVFGPGGVVSLVFASAVLARQSRPSVLSNVENRLTSTADALSAELGGPSIAEMRSPGKPTTPR